jgi:hypothetical protein
LNNRRNDYRHQFADDDRLRVDLSALPGRRRVTGQMVNLSVGGLAFQGEAPLRLDPGAPVVAHFAIPHGLRRFVIPSAVVHDGAGGVGLRFLPLEDPVAQEEREKALWVFLMDEQRRERRLRRAGAQLGST